MASIAGRVLLGWMEKTVAVNFLLNNCDFDPPIDAARAEIIWQGYRTAVEALPDRAFAVLPNLGLNVQEAAHSIKFKNYMLSFGPSGIQEVAKFDLREMTVIQYYVVTARSQGYASRVLSQSGWLEECLPLNMRSPASLAFKVFQNGLSTYSETDLPHGEFLFYPSTTGEFTASQLAHYVTAMKGADRTFLTAGYHRCFAKVLNAPIATVPSAAVAVTKNTLVSPVVATAAPGLITVNGVDPLCTFGVRAAKFGDFFTDGLFMDVNLRKKKFQLQIHANMVAVDDPT